MESGEVYFSCVPGIVLYYVAVQNNCMYIISSLLMFLPARATCSLAVLFHFRSGATKPPGINYITAGVKLYWYSQRPGPCPGLSAKHNKHQVNDNIQEGLTKNHQQNEGNGQQTAREGGA